MPIDYKESINKLNDLLKDSDGEPIVRLEADVGALQTKCHSSENITKHSKL